MNKLYTIPGCVLKNEDILQNLYQKLYGKYWIYKNYRVQNLFVQVT